MEQFKDYNGYLVGNEGTIKNKYGKVIGRSPNANGYYRTYIKGELLYTHRLVAMVWVENNDPEATQVDHINGIRNDNRSDNLRWVCPNDNSKNKHSKNYFKQLGIAYVDKRQKSDKYKEYTRNRYLQKKNKKNMEAL